MGGIKGDTRSLDYADFGSRVMYPKNGESNGQSRGRQHGKWGYIGVYRIDTRNPA